MSRLLPELLKKKQHHVNLVGIARSEVSRLLADVDKLQAGIDDEFVMIGEIDRAIAALEPAPIPEPETQETSYPNPYWEIRYNGPNGPAVQRWHEQRDAELSLGAFEQAELWLFDPVVGYELFKSVPVEPAPTAEPETQTGEGVEIPPGFTKWESGYCPFDIGTHVEVLTRKCGVWPVTIKPEAPLLWEHENHDTDIIAYRIIEPAPTPEDEPDDASEFAEPDDEASRAAAIELTADVEPVTTLGPPNAFLTSIMERGGTWHDGGDNPAPDWFCDIYVPAGASSLGDVHELEGQPSNAYVWNGWEVAYVKTQPMYAPQPEGTSQDPIPQPEWNAPQPTEGYAPVTNPEADALAKASEYYDPKAVADRNRFNPFSIFGHKRETEDA